MVEFMTKDEFREQVKQYCREHIQSLKDLSAKALQLGLDLKGGMSILLDVDPSSLEQRLGRAPTESEISEAIVKVLEDFNQRINMKEIV